MATYLDAILASHRRRVADAAQRPRAGHRELLDAAPPVRPFRAALQAASGLGVIAELKRRSPSKGDLAADVDAADVARRYEAGGAACLSVLTDQSFFAGSLDDLSTARAACSLPVLRKDFTVCEEDVVDARVAGADAVLLIVAALHDAELRGYASCAAALGMDALVEVHDEAELERALAAGATLVGVNQRDLITFEVDTDRAVRLAAAIPDGVVKVAESGVRGPEDAARLREAGYHAVLVGESVVTAADPSAAVRALVEA